MFCKFRKWILGRLPEPQQLDPDDPNVQALLDEYGEANEHPANLAATWDRD